MLLLSTSTSSATFPASGRQSPQKHLAGRSLRPLLLQREDGSPESGSEIGSGVALMLQPRLVYIARNRSHTVLVDGDAPVESLALDASMLDTSGTAATRCPAAARAET